MWQVVVTSKLLVHSTSLISYDRSKSVTSTLAIVTDLDNPCLRTNFDICLDWNFFPGSLLVPCLTYKGLMETSAASFPRSRSLQIVNNFNSYRAGRLPIFENIAELVSHCRTLCGFRSTVRHGLQQYHR